MPFEIEPLNLQLRDLSECAAGGYAAGAPGYDGSCGTDASRGTAGVLRRRGDDQCC